MYAVNTSRGVGKPAGFRLIKPDWDLEADETFTVDDLPPEDYVLNDDLVSFRAKNQGEIDQELDDEAAASFDQKAMKALALAVLDELQALGSTTTPAQFRDAVKAHYKALP